MCAVAVVLYVAVLIPSRSALAAVFLPEAPSGLPAVRVFLECLLLVAAMTPGDWVNGTLAGVLQGTSRQSVGAYLYADTYWLLGPPVLWLFTFHLGWDVHGIWAALAALANFQTLGMGV